MIKGLKKGQMLLVKEKEDDVHYECAYFIFYDGDCVVCEINNVTTMFGELAQQGTFKYYKLPSKKDFNFYPRGWEYEEKWLE